MDNYLRAACEKQSYFHSCLKAKLNEVNEKILKRGEHNAFTERCLILGRETA